MRAGSRVSILLVAMITWRWRGLKSKELTIYIKFILI